MSLFIFNMFKSCDVLSKMKKTNMDGTGGWRVKWMKVIHERFKDQKCFNDYNNKSFFVRRTYYILQSRTKIWKTKLN